MAIDQLSRHLVRLEVFQGLKPLQITEIARRAERIVYKPGQALISCGEQGDAAVLIVGGKAARTVGPGAGESTNEAIETGALLGEMAMLIETEHTSTIVAVEPVRALRITRRDMLEMMTDEPELADHFVHTIASRLNRLAAELRAIDAVLAGNDQETIRSVREPAAGAPAPAVH